MGLLEKRRRTKNEVTVRVIESNHNRLSEEIGMHD